ncbi:CoA pyrophosphatase [Herbaspirillum sp. RTI4]|uniref:CoA pyrophosphatase n=1 Tax=Herbaspirillum sp. RTI4 TaxID=3048640 RepID=UPI002AB5A6EB|nr:CoA pyrophosphatase [Herbaspirillum sp. RTI4]MDY7579832.1 CoA pyrophosphatase [Herbaspirillum sp. RTI4]MEA9981919.1 CoA pyrophosphatase [Herbaspirillum sp. RTI4]
MSRLSFDPLLVPVESIAGEAPLMAERLSSAWLRERFANPPEWFPEGSDEQRARQAGRTPSPAAVLIPIVLRSDGPTLLFTQRTADLRNHGGQVSFPGGRVEADDRSVIDTALRETEEEIGLPRSQIEVIGSLPEYFTGTGYRVTPVAALVQPPLSLTPNPGEVAEIFEVPFAFLMNGMNHERRTIVLESEFGSRTFYTMPYQRFFIWGATAGMLRNLFHFLRA